MKIFLKLAKELFDSGKAIGFKTNITEATGWLRNHSKGIGEELGNALSGKAKGVNDFLIKGDLYGKLFAHLDDVAKQYPDATLKVAAKNAKKGGFKVAKIEVKNGEKTLGNYALSLSDDGSIKVKLNGARSKMSEYIDREGVRIVASSDVGTAKASYNIAGKTGQMELSHAGEQVAIAEYVNKAGDLTRAGATYEKADNLVLGQMYYNNHEVSFLGNTEGLKQLETRYKTEIQRQKKEIEPLVLELLRPLRERFNTAIDLFKYNGKTNFEKFLSKNEITRTVKELKAEATTLEVLEKAGKISKNESQYLAQIKTDIDSAKKLIAITV